jgi:diguanylate cyclase (GGDEF)-like protein
VVISRLIELNGQIAFIRKSRSTKERLSSKGYDEIGELGENINLMLEEIDEIHTELSKFAAYDDMTGVYNRRIGLDILDGLIKSFKNSEATFSVIYLDVDNLKSVNDQFGHSTGDEMITDSIKLVLDTIPDPRYVVRLGGDEFLVILKNHDLEKAKSIEKKIVHAIDQFNQISNKVYSLSFSMGVIEYEKTMQLEEILELADKEMYHSKEKKRSKILNK